MYELAKREGQHTEGLARRILVDYLDIHALPNDTAEEWAEASVALTPEIMDEED